MNVRTVTSGDQTYGFLPSRPPGPRAHNHRVVVQARLVDELTDKGIAKGVGVSTSAEGLKPRVASDGVVGLTGNPARRLTDLANAPFDIDTTLSAPGYISRTLTSTIGPFNTGLGDPADFPDFFVAVDLGDIMLHRSPVHITGRVMRETGATRTPLGGTDIRITEIWRSEPGPDDDPTTLDEPPDILSLSPGLYRDRSLATNTFADRQIDVGAAQKTLLAPADLGETVVQLSDRVGLVVGELLALDAGAPAIQEFIEITAIEGGLSPDEPARVTLAYPIARARRIGDVAAPASVALGVGAAANPLRDGLVGDRTTHLNVIHPTVPVLGTIEIAGDGVTEYQTATQYQATTTADGSYRLPALSRVARLTIEADRADFAQPLIQTIAPAFGTYGQTIDFVHRP
ncbi:MAG: hypothetical protein ACR2OY_03750 [Boseongicola sp.]